MSKFGVKLRQCRIAKGLSQEDLAKLLGTTKQVVSNYERELRTPKVDYAVKYAQALDVPVQFLTDDRYSFSVWEYNDLLEDYHSASLQQKMQMVAELGIDPRIAADFAQVASAIGWVSSDPLPSNVLPFPDLRRVPRLGNIACGQPITAEENIEGYDDVPAYVKADFTLVCRGDSMTGARIYDGDIVCIRQCDSVNSGEIAAVLVDGEEATLKRVRLQENGIVLWPENPAYQPMIFTGADAQRVRIIGKATHFISVVR